MKHLKRLILSVLVLLVAVVAFTPRVKANSTPTQWAKHNFVSENVDVNIRYFTTGNNLSTLTSSSTLQIRDYGIMRASYRGFLEDLLKYYFSSNSRRPFVEWDNPGAVKNSVYIENKMMMPAAVGVENEFRIDVIGVVYEGETKQFMTKQNIDDNTVHTGNRLELRWSLDGRIVLDDYGVGSTYEFIRMSYRYAVRQNGTKLSEDVLYSRSGTWSSIAQVLGVFDANHPADNTYSAHMGVDDDFMNGYWNGAADYGKQNNDGSITKADDWGISQREEGWKDGRSEFGLWQGNHWWTAGQYGQHMFDKGAAGEANVLSLVVGGIFAFMSAIGSIEVLPGFRIIYIVGLFVIFGLVQFITGRSKKD